MDIQLKRKKELEITRKVYSAMRNVVLIGMPGAGKSTIGVILAKTLGFQFIDTDLMIQDQEKQLLKDIIQEKGLDTFIEIEERVNLDINTTDSVISPGGSVIYGENAMEHHRKHGVIIYIKLSYETISNRLGNIRKRGVVLKKDQDLKALFEERHPLYEKYADIVIDGEDKDVEMVMEEIQEAFLDYIGNNGNIKKM